MNKQKVAGLDYLSGFVEGTFIPDATLPKEQLAPFLKVALYNHQQAEKELQEKSPKEEKKEHFGVR